MREGASEKGLSAAPAGQSVSSSSTNTEATETARNRKASRTSFDSRRPSGNSMAIAVEQELQRVDVPLRFEPIGPERMNKTVDAPAVLLCASFATIADGLTRFAGRPDVPGAKSSLFVYGFPPDEEAGVLNRLRGLVAAT